MSNFQVYFTLGFKHIANWGAIDHILFMAALALRYYIHDWKKLIVLVTAFTIGHTASLLLSFFNIVSISTKFVEFAIACTIIIAAISNLFVKKFVYKAKFPAIYFFALAFGLIHGLGFSNDLKQIVGTNFGAAINILYANIGIEVAQLLFVAIVLLISFVCTSILKLNRREYILFTSGAIFGIALQIAISRFPFF